MGRPLVSVAAMLALLLAGCLPATAGGDGGPEDRFSWSCRFSMPEFFAGENASATVNLTNQKEDMIAVQAVGIQLDWMKAYEHWYDENLTGPANLTGGGSREFNMAFQVPADAAPIDHVYHVCVEYFVNRSGTMRLETFCSDNQSDFRVTDFDIGIVPMHREIVAGGKAVFAISVTATNGLAQNVTLEDAGPGAPENRYMKPEIEPRTVNAQNGSTAVLGTTNDTGLGVYSFGVRASLRDRSRVEYATLTVLGRPCFTVEVSPRSRSVEAGGTAVFKVSVMSFHNFSDDVSLSWLERPHGSTITFRPSVVHGNGTAEMTVRTAADGQTGGSIPVKFEAAGPAGALNATARLTIRAPPTALDAPDLVLVLLAIATMGAAAFGLLRRNRLARR